MRKRWLLLVAIVLFALTGCKKEPVKVDLTADNFSKYIILNVQFDNADTKTKRGLLGTEYKGTATLKATAKLKKDVNIEDVVIEGLVSPSGMLWASETYKFKLELDKNGEAEYSKDVETDYSILKPEEKPLLGIYTGNVEEGQFLTMDNKVLITSLSGSVYDVIDN